MAMLITGADSFGCSAVIRLACIVQPEQVQVGGHKTLMPPPSNIHHLDGWMQSPCIPTHNSSEGTCMVSQSAAFHWNALWVTYGRSCGIFAYTFGVLFILCFTLLLVYHYGKQENVFTASVLQLHGLQIRFKEHKSVIRRKQSSRLNRIAHSLLWGMGQLLWPVWSHDVFPLSWCTTKYVWDKINRFGGHRNIQTVCCNKVCFYFNNICNS